MQYEDMVRMLESGEELPDYCQEEFDRLIKLKEKSNGKANIRFARRVFTSYDRSQGMVVSGQDGKPGTTRGNTKLQRQGKVHSGSIQERRTSKKTL
tara:strand:+ start:383 stop:670 length:288 start_codon:yes stop_codon:yes gene_type:complete